MTPFLKTIVDTWCKANTLQAIMPISSIRVPMTYRRHIGGEYKIVSSLIKNYSFNVKSERNFTSTKEISVYGVWCKQLDFADRGIFY